MQRRRVLVQVSVAVGVFFSAASAFAGSYESQNQNSWDATSSGGSWDSGPKAPAGSGMTPAPTFPAGHPQTPWQRPSIVDDPSLAAGVERNDPPPNEYYTLDDVDLVGTRRVEMQSFIMSSLSDLQERVNRALSLMHWYLHSETPPVPAEPYNRLHHFGTWQADEDQTSCMNTRAVVLQRDSLQPVEFAPTNHCTIVKGQWKDPYTGAMFDTAKQIQIDHVVPLKHAYTTGAFGWSAPKRCLYANFLAAGYHLLSVSGHENMKKGDRDPSGYMPPNPAFACDYIQRWLKVKMIWGLYMTPDEVAKLGEVVRESQCQAKDMRMDQNELIQMRAELSQYHACQNFDGSITAPSFVGAKHE